MADLYLQADEIYLALNEYDKAKKALSKVVDYHVLRLRLQFIAD